MVASLLVVSDHRMVVDVVSADVILVVGGETSDFRYPQNFCFAGPRVQPGHVE